MAAPRPPTSDDQANPAAEPAAGAPDTSKPSFYRHARAWVTQRHFGRWSTLVATLGCLVLLGLGTWQIARLHQKNDLIHHVVTQLRDDELDLRRKLPRDARDWAMFDYRHVVIQGEWLDVHNLQLVPRTHDGDYGYHLATPLQLKDGQVLLVNRGWMPAKMDAGPQSQNGLTVIAGVLRLAPAAIPFGVMPNKAKSIRRNIWSWPDLTKIADTIGVPPLAPVILYQERTSFEKDAYPIGGQAQIAIRNEHKQYALTWYALAIAALIIWLTAARSTAPVAPPVSTDNPDA